MGSQAPLGKENLFDTPGANLPGFVREVARALMREQGYTKSRAIATAISRIKQWAAKGNPKAVKALAQWEAAKGKAHATPNKTDLSNFEQSLINVLDFATLGATDKPGDTVDREKEKKDGKKKGPGYKASKEGLPPGAVGYKHGWQPVDENGNPVGEPQKPDFLKEAQAKHDAAKGKKDAEKAQKEKDKKTREAKRKEAAKAVAARKAEREAKSKTSELNETSEKTSVRGDAEGEYEGQRAHEITLEDGTKINGFQTEFGWLKNTPEAKANMDKVRKLVEQYESGDKDSMTEEELAKAQTAIRVRDSKKGKK